MRACARAVVRACVRACACALHVYGVVEPYLRGKQKAAEQDIGIFVGLARGEAGMHDPGNQGWTAPNSIVHSRVPDRLERTNPSSQC